jgi:hypothetical protein
MKNGGHTVQYEDRLKRNTPSALRLDIDLAGLQGQRELRLLRICAAMLAGLLAAAALWIIPWFPIGMRQSDFSIATAVALALVAACGGGTALLLMRWAPLFTEEPKSELLRALFGERLSVRGKVRFVNRLRFQCEEGLRGRNKIFSLAVIELPPLQRDTPEGASAANAVIREVRQVIRTADVLGDSEDREIWVLLTGSGGPGAQRACERIATALPQALAGRDDAAALSAVRIGWAAFETDGRDPESLFRVARQRRAAGAVPPGDEAAA